jgi:cytochrome c oxidase cbb3-type subunit II
VKSNFLFFLGLFGALLVSWLGIVIGSNTQLGSLAPYYDDNDGTTHPEWLAGVAAEGQLVYRDLGCIACHTQQVRRPSFGSDQARGWGDRQSVARDYIYQPFPQLGLSRTGPDLTNVGDRKPAFDPDDFLNLLYTGSGGMPSYRFLFERRQIGAEAQPSDRALKLTGKLKPPAGWEIVPTRRADALVGYLVNLKTTYTYPEAAPFVAGKGEGAPAKAAPTAPAAAKPAPAGSGAAAPAAPAGASGTAPTPTAAQGTNAAPSPAAPAAAAPAAPAAGAPAPGAPPAPAAAPTATPAPSPAAPAPATAPPSGAAPTPAPSSGTPTTPAPSPSAPAPAAAGDAPAPAASAPAAPNPAPTPAASGAAAPSPSAPAAPAPGTTPPAGSPATPSPTTANGGTK